EEEPPTPAEGPPARSRRWIWITAAAVVLTAAVTTQVVIMVLSPASGGTVQKFELVRDDVQTDFTLTPSLSPDGQAAVYASDGRLWVRELNRLEPRELPGTDGASQPTWSPDGQFIAYVQDDGIWKVPVQGGEAAAIAIGVGEIDTAGGLSWGPNGTLVYATGGSGLSEVSARGGDPRTILEPEPETEADHHNPTFLPDGSILYVAHRVATAPDTIRVLKGGEPKTILQIENEGIREPIYSSSGHILYRRSTSQAGLWAVPFSLASHEVTGEPFLVDPEGSNASAGGDGVLLYIRGASASLRQLVWVNREGVVEETAGQPQSNIGSPVLSPDGRYVAVMGQENENWDIWIHDLARSTRTRLTFGSKMDWDPTWMPDGKTVVFWDGETRALSSRAADGTGQTEPLLTEDLPDSGVPTITPDGKTMVFWAVPRSPTGAPRSRSSSRSRPSRRPCRRAATRRSRPGCRSRSAATTPAPSA
ncbi:MAG: hypothetical protein R3344_12985, partial [Acidobacteriota bacterium]|nr:hypothetical protein [Acidobacteriota bacterium]